MKKTHKLCNTYYVLLITALVFTMSCGGGKNFELPTGTLSALNELIIKWDYLPVQNPRDFDGVKSIIKIGDGKVDIISPPSYCLGGLKSGGGVTTLPFTEKHSAINLTAKVGSTYLKELTQIDAEAAFGKANLKDVIVYIDSARVEKIYPVELEDFLAANTLSSACSKRFKADSVYAIIYETLIATQLSYSFVLQDSTNFKITSDFLKLLQIDTKYVSTNKEKTVLSIRNPMIIGFKARRINEFLRALTGSTKIGSTQELTLEDIEKK